jgi:hypothetical protein
MMIMLLLLCSCDKITKIPSEGISPVISESPEPSMSGVIPSPTQSQEPTVTPAPTSIWTDVPHTSQPSQSQEPTVTPTPTFVPIESPSPQRPTEYTDEKYFYFDALHGTILDYDMAGGVYVNIPETINGVTVTTIGENAFEMKKIYGVVIPDTVTKISGCAFRYCGVHEVDLGNGVEYIGDSAFYNSRKNEQPRQGSDPLYNYQSDGLTTLTLPETVKYIGDGAFSSNSLTSIVIPQGVEYLSGFGNNNLSYVEISDTVKHIGDYAFSNNSLTNVVIPQGVEYLSGFNNNSLSNVIIPDSVINIGSYAFTNNQLTSITIPNKVECIGTDAFKNNVLTNVTIPDSVTNIWTGAFLGLTEDKIQLGMGFNRYFVIVDDSIIGYICSIKGKLVIPYYEGVTKIAANAFRNRLDVSSVDISEGIRYIGDNAFRGTTANERWHSVSLPGSIQYIGNSAFTGSPQYIYTDIKGSFTWYLVYGPNYSDRSAQSNLLYSFPLDRQEIINKDISIDIKSEDVSLGKDWIRRYICSKYIDKKINNSNVEYLYSDKYSITDQSSYEGRTIISQGYLVSLNTVNDIEGLTRSSSGYYRITLQAVFVADKINSRFILSGIIPESEMIDSRRELYDYVKADSRFVLGEYIPDVHDAFSMRPFPTLAENQDFITTVDLKNSQIIAEMTKDIVFPAENIIGPLNTIIGNTEKYLPVGEDKVVFFLPDPVCTLYMVNYKTNEIVWSKDYPGATSSDLNYTDRYADLGTYVFQFSYYKTDKYLYDYFNTEGEIIAQHTAFDSREYSIPGTKWKAINDDYNVYLKDTETDSVYMVLCGNKTNWPVEDYFFCKALDENRFIYQTQSAGEGMLFERLSVYDIRDGSSTKLDLYNNGYYLISNEKDKFVTSACIVGGTGSQPTMFIYDYESNEAVDIKSFVDDFPFIVDYSLSKDGRYAALLTGKTDIGFEIPRVVVADSILLIDLTTKEVLLQDSITLTGGRISFLSDNTLVINDDKMLIYIDVPGMEQD